MMDRVLNRVTPRSCRVSKGGLCPGRKNRRSRDNELYRSNSFRFERFDRNEEEASKQVISLYDEYSVPVDFVNKQKSSVVPAAASTAGSSQEPPLPSRASPSVVTPTFSLSVVDDQIEVVENYSDPRDSKTYLEPGHEASCKLYTDRAYANPCLGRSWEARPYSSRDDEDSPDECVLNQPDLASPQIYKVRHPSPYYYGDLFLDESEALARRLFASEHERCRRRAMPPRQDDPSDFELSPPPPPPPPPLLQSNHPLPDMARERRLYETAFDSKVSSVSCGGELEPELCRTIQGLSLRPADSVATVASIVSNAGASAIASTSASALPKSRAHGRRTGGKYSSTESMATTSSSAGSLESLRSSTSEGNRSTSSSESQRSSSLSSHSSDQGGSGNGPGLLGNLHLLSPISDRSQEPSETGENNRNNNSGRCSPEDGSHVLARGSAIGNIGGGGRPRRLPNRNITHVTLQQQPSSSQGSDSGISIAPELAELPFDMPKLRRRRATSVALQHDSGCGSAASLDLPLPFDMPKLRRRLKASPSGSTRPALGLFSEPASMDSASAELSLDLPKRHSPPVLKKPSLSLDMSQCKKRMDLCLNLSGASSLAGESINVNLPLERQGWYHGSITRLEAENTLRVLSEGSYLVRNSESTRMDYSLSLKSARGFMHMRIQRCPETGKFILGQFSKPFESIPEMIHHYTVNRLPIRGAEHMCLLHPVIDQLL